MKRLAHRLRDKIEGVLNTDRTVRLVVQLEAALHDSRFEVIYHACQFGSFDAVLVHSFVLTMSKAVLTQSGVLLSAGSSTSQG